MFESILKSVKKFIAMVIDIITTPFWFIYGVVLGIWLTCTNKSFREEIEDIGDYIMTKYVNKENEIES